MKKILLAIAALLCTTLSFAQEFMVVEHVNGVYNAIDVDYIKQGYFITYEASGSGTAEDPFNIAAANAKCKEIGTNPSAHGYYIKGLIVSTPRNISGTTTFYIADDISGINKLYAYQVQLYGNYELQRGDEVVLFCSLYNYSNYSPEATGVIISINGQTIETPKPQGSGTLEDPYNVQGALKYIAGLGADVQSDKDIYVKGYVTTIKEQFSAQYGNAQFTMSDSKEGGNTFTFFRGLYLGNKKWVEGDATLAEGDEVIICGKVVYYKGTTPETVQGKAYIYSLNGKTDDTPVETSGTLAKPFTPAEANAFIATLPADTNTDKDYYIKGKLVKYVGEFDTKYGNASFYISEDGNESSEQFYVYRTLYLGNVKYSDESWEKPKVGDEVVICGKLVNYRGTTPETVTNQSYIYSLQSGNAINAITIAEFNAAPESNDVWYQLTGTVKNLKDGDQYGSFDLEDNTGSVYVYGLLSEKGGEKKKFQELVATYGIANDKKITIIGNRGAYKEKIEVLNAYFVSIEDGGGSGGTTSVIKENFKEAGKVTWAINNVNVPAGAEVWTYDSKYGMKATAYIGGANNAAESWLISPAYDLSNVTGATLSIHHAANYFANGADKECAVMVSTDYKSGAPSTATWKAITIDTWPSSWTFVDGTGSMSDFDGKSNVCIALKYTSTAEKSGTWEVESIEITGGGSASGGGDTPTPSGNHGTADAPLTVAQAMALIDAESTIDEAYVKGKISQIDSYSSQYKSITYWISDDGGTTTQLEVYSGKGLNGADFAAKEDLTVGQTVTVKGKLKKYNDIYEFDKTSSIISIEGGSGGGDSNVGTYDNPYTVTSGIAAEGDGATTKVENVYIKGYIVGWVEGQVLADGAHFNGTATIKSNILIAASASETNIVNCMPVQLPSGVVRNGINLQDNASFYGKEVLLYGNLDKYFGAAGVKAVTYAEIGESSFGTKPQ